MVLKLRFNPAINNVKYKWKTYQKKNHKIKILKKSMVLEVSSLNWQMRFWATVGQDKPPAVPPMKLHESLGQASENVPH